MKIKRTTKIIIPLITIIVTSLILAFIFAGNSPLKNNPESERYFYEEGNDGDMFNKAETVEDKGAVLSDEVCLPDIAMLIEELKTGIQKADNGGLFLCIEEKNALGYYSNLVMANRLQKVRQDASEYLRLALELYSTDEVRLELAFHLMEIGREADAETEYLKLLHDETALQALIDMDGDPIKIGETLLNNKQWSDGEKYLRSVIENSSRGDLNTAALKRFYAIALGQQNKFKEALPFFEVLFNEGGPEPDIAWWYARCLEAVGRTSEAKKIYYSLKEEGAYRLGIILQREGHLLDAADAFNYSNEAASKWVASKIWDEAGMAEKAVEAYTNVAEEQSSYQDDAAYRAYILSKRLGVDEIDNFFNILNKHPAWMERIGMKLIFPNLYEIDMDELAHNEFEYIYKAEQYINEGYPEAAEIELAIGAKDATFEEKLILGEWYAEKGLYYPAVMLGISSLKDKPTRKGYELAYPRAFEEIVLNASKKYSVEVPLIWAIMREESHFRHEVISWAGAMGLMQIMPSTGKDIATGLGLNIKDRDLLNPEINIEFGTFYIRSMLNIFGQDIDKATAAYNGGAGNVKSWSQSKIGTSKEDFPTAITFFETQEYITKVKNSYYIYKWLYGI